MGTDRRAFLKLLTTAAASAAFPASIARALAIPANQRHWHHQRRRARRFHDAGEPFLRSLLRHAARRARIRRSANRQAALGQERLAPDGPHATPTAISCRSIPERLTLACNSSKIWRTTGQARTRPGTTASTTSGYRTKARPPWRTSRAAIFHSTMRSRTLSRSAMPTTAPCWDPTDPNRYHMWTGWVGNDGSGGGPVIDNAEAGYGWSTYPELLQAAGISWKIYQDIGDGLDAARFLGLDR